MAGEEAAPQTRLPQVVAPDMDEGAEEGEARMRQRIALAGRREQHRGAAVRFQVGGVRGETGHQDERRTVKVGRDIDQRSEGMAGVAIECRQRSRPGRA